MTAPHLQLVDNSFIENEIADVAKGIVAKRKEDAISRRGGPRDGDVLPPDTGRYNDLENAARFLAFAGDDLLYCAQAKKWLIWQGTHWQFDVENFVFELALDFARNLYNAEVPTKESLKNADRANNRAGFNAMLEFAACQLTVSIDTFDQDPYKLNCLNGTLDVRTGALQPHSREDRITRVVASNYDADAVSTVFNDFLATIQPDASIRAFLQRSIGYSLLGVVRERSFWILYGTGNNGKSVFVNLFNELLGEYASATTSSSIMAVRQSGGIPNDIARLKGKRFIIIPETEENERINAALIKALSAGDTVTARFLFGEFFDFAFSGKLWIATNHKPIITDHSKGFWDRLKLVPFTTDIPADKVIKSDDLMRDLLADSPAILAWAVQGCRDYFEAEGLDVPDVIKAEIAKYKHEQDSIAQFLEERCETYEQAVSGEGEPFLSITAADYQVKNADIYKAYVEFCKENGEYVLSQRRLSQKLIERRFRQVNSGGRKWEGLRVLKME